jgi:hypothetical protein
MGWKEIFKKSFKNFSKNVFLYVVEDVEVDINDDNNNNNINDINNNNKLGFIIIN